jgi:pimeloyl-ACP methyl ester carboxylesterase
MSHPPTQAPMRRRGPRPVALHLILAGSRGMLAIPSPSAWPSWNGAWPRSSEGRARLERIRSRLAELAAGQPETPERFQAAVLRRLMRDDAALLAGIAAYRRHPARRTLEDPPAIWREGSARLLDYGGEGPALLVVPSLVNRAHVLDLAEGASMLRHLAARGARPLLLDWGWPGAEERGFTLTDHIAGRLERALMAAPGPVVLAGYCMGGLLALAAALRRPERVRGLALLATPWDFHAGPEGPRQGRAIAALLPALEPVLEANGALPVDAIQAMFAMLDPFALARKFRAFGKLRQDTPEAALFVVLEDWLNDGVPLAAPVARETLGDWYGRNAPALGNWRVAGMAVRPEDFAGPAFLAIPSRDRIVPPASALPLAARMPRAVVHVAPAGHIGMVAGRTAEAALWGPLLAWLRGLP